MDRGLYKHYGIYAGGGTVIHYRLYSPAETLRRAKSRLGESSYNLVFNNCEHFVVWCKTDGPGVLKKDGSVLTLECSKPRARIYFPQFLGEVEILDPPRLRAWFAEKFKKACALYEK